MKLYDITLPLHPDLAVWPGDTPFDFQLSWKQSEGASVNLGSVTMSVHTGSHADAPFHFLPDGTPMDAVDLSPYVGPAVLVDVRGRDPIRPEDVREAPLEEAPRLLLRTGGWPDHSRFPESIPVMSLELPRYLQERGVVLVGLDVPSVDALDSTELPLHRALAACGISILESLDLAAVPAGRYELIALPLKLVGADGSPVRAVLRG